ncbi:hypothetical protein PsorP6_013340 [Peronosclerospora sorghi]|uniref:Uncharacterized protein n=1 Tax=Peronosclerospora sorghi TaxID=230839 RepID=A0ACC0WGY0_9STRA|nr:hypothetical protein PsorP6_013340 [Peronosclerospora sorghi]
MLHEDSFQVAIPQHKITCDLHIQSGKTRTMAEDSLFGTSMDTLPAFFTNGTVDDTKYESLLADLRAHDLLGPVESGATQASETSGASLFFNDAFAAVFMGNFQSDAAAAPESKTASGRAPPGLSAPPGLATPSEDLKWARGQQEFLRLEEKFHGATMEKRSETTTSGQGLPSSGSLEHESELDESQVPGLRGLGLDDDDAMLDSRPAHEPKPPPPLPRAPPVPSPPMPPTETTQAQNAWNTPPSAPLMAYSNQPYTPPPARPSPQSFSPPMMHMQSAAARPPRMGMFPRGPPPSPPCFGRGPPPPMQSPFPAPPGAFGHTGVPHFPPPMHPPAFKMMTPRDVHFVMQQQMKWLRSSDPFSDDYYFHNYMQKRARGRPSVPLPSWKLQHVKSIDPRDVQREVKSRNWESEYHVLGRNTKSSLYRPKQLLSLQETSTTSLTTTDDPESTRAGPRDSPDEGSTTAPVSATAESSHEAASVKHVRGSSPGAQVVAAEAHAAKVLRMSEDASRDSVFANETWTLRLELDRGMQCLLSLQDARHLLDARGINVLEFHSMKEEDMDPALVELRSRTTSLLVELAALLGVRLAPARDAAAPSCDVQQLRKMMATTKGKMLVSRALPLLHPSARFVLLPYLVDYLLSGRRDQGHVHHHSGDERLCQTLVLMLLYVPPAPSAELLTACLERAVHDHDVASLSIVLRDRARAEALQALLQRGGSAVQQLETAPPTNAEHVKRVQEQWEQHQRVFVQLATTIKHAS